VANSGPPQPDDLLLHVFQILPSDHPKRRLRLKRFFIAVASYALWSLLCVFFLRNESGLLEPWWMALIVLGIIATNIYFYVMLRTGWSERRADPAMSAEQIVVAMSWLLVPMMADTSVRDLLLIGDVMIMMFGVLALRGFALTAVAAYAFFSYAALVYIDYRYFDFRFDAADEARRLAMLAGMMAWCALFGNYVSALRHRLSDRNRDLNSALKDIRVLTSQDDLTQAFNRRYIMDALQKEKARCDRSPDTFGVILLDIDHFKSINDRYGHLAGDRVLIALCERLRGALRGMDVIDSLVRSSSLARYGGEEFIVLLPQTPLAGALRCAERLCAVTRERPFEDVFNVTLSAGVATYRAGEPVEGLLQRADQGLYRAKDAGRDQTVTLEQIETEPEDSAPKPASGDNVVVGHFGASRPKDPS